MAAANRLKIMLSIMRELNDGNNVTASNYGIDTDTFCQIIESCQDKGYIAGAVIQRAWGGKVVYHSLTNARLTVDGMEYLLEKSPLMQGYRGLKEFREWLPF